MAALLGILGGYWCIHAGFIAYGVYLTYSMIFGTPPIPVESAPELHSIYASLLWGLAAFGAFGFLSVVASIGFFGSKRWATPTWLAISVAMVIGILVEVLVLDAPWLQFHFELTMLVISWVLLWALTRRRSLGPVV